MLANTLESMDLKIPIENIDIDEERSTTVLYGVRGVPLMILIDDNDKELGRLIGAKPASEIEKWLETLA